MTALSVASSDRIDALVVGTAFLDVVFTGLARSPQPGEEVWADRRVFCAGGMANNAIALARLGLQTSLVTALGDDPAGDLVAGMLAVETGLDLTSLHRDPRIDTPVTIALSSGHDRAFISHGELDPVPLVEMAPELPPARTCFASLHPTPTEWIDLERDAGARIFAGVAYDDRDGWSEDVLAQLGSVDTLVLNEVEALAYTRRDDLDEALDALAERVPVVVITRGAAGVVALDSAAASGDRIRIPAVPVTAVDATGAGDCFVSALMHASLLGGPLANGLRYASVCAGLSVTGLGGSTSAPRVGEVLAFLGAFAPSHPEYRDLADWLGSSAPGPSPIHQAVPSNQGEAV
jgi:sugar/nucleoside kinase (ribokinase family)